MNGKRTKDPNKPSQMHESDSEREMLNALDAMKDPAGHLLRRARRELLDIAKQVDAPAHRILLRAVAIEIVTALSILEKKGHVQARRM